MKWRNSATKEMKIWKIKLENSALPIKGDAHVLRMLPNRVVILARYNILSFHCTEIKIKTCFKSEKILNKLGNPEEERSPDRPRERWSEFTFLQI